MIVQTRKMPVSDMACTVGRPPSARCQDGRVIDAPSWWWAELGGLPDPRPPLPGDRDAEVCIVGAGFTGLWTAYELRRADPSLGVVVLEREVAGFGASGRNGGWVLGEPSTGRRMRGGRAGGDEAPAGIEATVDRSAKPASARASSDFVKGGTLQAPERRPARAGTRVAARAERRPGLRAGARRRRAGRALHAAMRASSRRSWRGLASAPSPGATIHAHGGDRVAPRRGPHGERHRRAGSCGPPGATRPRSRRAPLPLASSMIVTEPLDDATWRQIG
jgi:hypothetical protein